jgi:hypothetical protein
VLSSSAHNGFPISLSHHFTTAFGISTSYYPIHTRSNLSSHSSSIHLPTHHPFPLNVNLYPKPVTPHALPITPHKSLTILLRIITPRKQHTIISLLFLIFTYTAWFDFWCSLVSRCVGVGVGCEWGGGFGFAGKIGGGERLVYYGSM